MSRPRMLACLALVVFLLLAACGATPTATPVPPTATPVPPTSTPVPPTATPMPPAATPAPPTATPLPATPTRNPLTPTPLADKMLEYVDVGGYSLVVQCQGTGTIPVVLENGLGQGYSYWTSAIRPLLADVRVCMYNRAGSAGSDKAPKSPRTTMDWAQDLHTLLGKIGLKPPYVMVGHSFGGHSLRLYANRWPAEVAGIVLVDASHPDQDARWCQLLPARSDNEIPALASRRADCADLTATRKVPAEGGVDMLASSDEVRASGKLGNIPLIVLSESPTTTSKYSPGGDLPSELFTKMNQTWAELQKDLLGLSTRSTHLVAKQAGHLIQNDEPEAITEAIRLLLKQIKGQ